MDKKIYDPQNLSNILDRLSTVEQDLAYIKLWLRENFPDKWKAMKKYGGKLNNRKIQIVLNEFTVNKMQTDLPGFTPEVNKIAFVVKSKAGQLLDGVVAIIKDLRNEPIRAAKSNKLGQVLFSIPLSNGKYTMELSKDGYTFPIYVLEINNSILPAFELRSLN